MKKGFLFFLALLPVLLHAQDEFSALFDSTMFNSLESGKMLICDKRDTSFLLEFEIFKNRDLEMTKRLKFPDNYFYDGNSIGSETLYRYKDSIIKSYYTLDNGLYVFTDYFIAHNDLSLLDTNKYYFSQLPNDNKVTGIGFVNGRWNQNCEKFYYTNDKLAGRIEGNCSKVDEFDFETKHTNTFMSHTEFEKITWFKHNKIALISSEEYSRTEKIYFTSYGKIKKIKIVLIYEEGSPEINTPNEFRRFSKLATKRLKFHVKYENINK